VSLVAALQAALATEHAVIYGYGVVAARLRAHQPSYRVDRTDALRRLGEHQRRRDTLARLVRAGGGRPVAADPAYGLPIPVSDVQAAVDLGSTLEAATAGCWWDVIAASGPDTAERRLGVTALADATAWVQRWAYGGSTHLVPALPGQAASDQSGSGQSGSGQPGPSQPSTTPSSSVSSSITPSGSTS
jgi:hypothetical protein